MWCHTGGSPWLPLPPAPPLRPSLSLSLNLAYAWRQCQFHPRSTVLPFILTNFFCVVYRLWLARFGWILQAVRYCGIYLSAWPCQWCLFHFLLWHGNWDRVHCGVDGLWIIICNFFGSCAVMITVSFFYYVFNLREWASAVTIAEIIFITLKGKMKLSGIIYITLMLKLYSAKALANSFVHGFVA